MFRILIKVGRFWVLAAVVCTIGLMVSVLLIH
jgi:hypothetical protein